MQSPDATLTECDRYTPVGKCVAKAEFFFHLQGTKLPIPRCGEHADEMRQTMVRVVKPEHWSETGAQASTVI
jgi:hypothetical protein